MIQRACVPVCASTCVGVRACWCAHVCDEDQGAGFSMSDQILRPVKSLGPQQSSLISNLTTLVGRLNASQETVPLCNHVIADCVCFAVLAVTMHP